MIPILKTIFAALFGALFEHGFAYYKEWLKARQSKKDAETIADKANETVDKETLSKRISDKSF